MKKPDDLVQLLDELSSESLDNTVEGVRGSHAVIHFDDSDDDERGVTLTLAECRLLLCSRRTVIQMHEALGSPSGATISLFDLSIDSDVVSELERLFSAVDEV